LTQNIFDAFSEMNALFVLEEKLSQENSLNDRNSSKDQAQNEITSVSSDIWIKKEEFEQKIGITIGDQDYFCWKKSGFRLILLKKLYPLSVKFFKTV
jgi:hypothetical protein